VDLFDFCRRINSQKINRRGLESLIKAGALDGLGADRAGLMASLSTALAAADQAGKAQASRQDDMFGLETGGQISEGGAVYVSVPPWSEEMRLEGEKETLGLYLTGHPIARFESELAHIVDSTIAELKPVANKTVVVAGLIVGMRTMQTRRGDRMAFVTLDDRTGRMELAVFSDLFEKYRDLLIKDALLVVEGQVSVDEYSGGFKMSADRLYNIDQSRATFAAAVQIETRTQDLTEEFIRELGEILRPATPGMCPVVLRHQHELASVDLMLGPEWKVIPSTTLLTQLEKLAGPGQARLIYPPTRRSVATQDSSARHGRRNFSRNGAGAMIA